jgi:hypothetical protein
MLAISPGSSVGMGLGVAAATYRVVFEHAGPGFNDGGSSPFDDYAAAKDFFLGKLVDVQAPNAKGVKPTSFYVTIYRQSPGAPLFLAAVGTPSSLTGPSDRAPAGTPESPPAFEPALATTPAQIAAGAPFYKKPLVWLGAAGVIGLSIFLIKRSR